MPTHSPARFVAVLCLCTAAAIGQTLPPKALVAALQKGGLVIVMRHAASPRETPDERTADPRNTNHERQLDQEGKATATAMGKAFRDLRIPVGQVLSSPTFRALQTIRYAQFGMPQTHPELGDRGRSMQGVSDADAEWLRQQITHLPSGTNTLIVTHMPNITAAFPQLASGLSDGEALIFGPSGPSGANLLGRVKIEDWPNMRN